MLCQYSGGFTYCWVAADEQKKSHVWSDCALASSKQCFVSISALLEHVCTALCDDAHGWHDSNWRQHVQGIHCCCCQWSDGSDQMLCTNLTVTHILQGSMLSKPFTTRQMSTTQRLQWCMMLDMVPDTMHITYHHGVQNGTNHLVRQVLLADG